MLDQDARSRAGSRPPRSTPDTPAALATRAAPAGSDRLSNEPFQAHLLRFSGPPGTFIPIPLYQIFVPTYWEGNFGNGALLRDKVVVVGPGGKLGAR